MKQFRISQQTHPLNGSKNATKSKIVKLLAWKIRFLKIAALEDH